MSDTTYSESNELADKKQNDSKGENDNKWGGHRDPPEESHPQSNTEGSDSCSVTTDSDQEDANGNDMSEWKRQIDLVHIGRKALYVANPESEDDSSTDDVNSEDENSVADLTKQGKNNHNTIIANKKHNVPCEEKKKIPMIFSSKCRKSRATKLQTGEQPDANDGANEPKPLPDEPKPKIELKSNQYKQKGKGETSDVGTLESDNMRSKGCAPRNKSLEWETSQRKKQVQPSPKNLMTAKRADHNYHQSRPRNHHHTRRRRIGAKQSLSPVDKMKSTRVHLTSSSSNERSQQITQERLPQHQPGIVNNFGNNFGQSQEGAGLIKYGGPSSGNFNWGDSKIENPTSVLDSQNEYADTEAHTAVTNTSLVKDPVVKILRNPIQCHTHITQGNPHKNTDGEKRNVLPNTANQCHYNEKTMEEMGKPFQIKRDHDQSHNEYSGNRESEKETGGKNQEIRFQHSSGDNLGANQNKFKSGLDASSFLPKNGNAVESKQQEFFSSCSGYPGKRSSKNSVGIRSNSKINRHLLQAYDVIDVPYGVLMTVKHVRGMEFYDFSVMTMRNWDLFKSLHSSLQTCGKAKMKICQVGMQCVVKYRAADLKDAQEEWYRGVVITKDAASRFGIYLTDLGIATVVHRDEIHELKTPLPRQCNLGPLAIRVRALNVKVNDDDLDEVSEQFDMLVRERPVKIRITHKDIRESYKFGCHLHVQHMAKWFDAGALLKKFLIGDQVTQENIWFEEKARQSIVPCQRFILRDEVLATPEDYSGKTEIKVTHVVSPNEFYVTTKNSSKIMTDLEDQLKNDRFVLQMKPVKSLKELSYPMFLWNGKGNSQSRARVKIVEVSENVNGIKVLIQKVDTGETLTVAVEELKKLPHCLQRPTACAYKCSLPVKPVTKIQRNNNGMLSFEKATKNLEQLKQLQNTVLLKVFSLEHSNLHIVDLYSQTSKQSCASTYVEKGWAELSSHNVNLSLSENAANSEG